MQQTRIWPAMTVLAVVVGVGMAMSCGLGTGAGDSPTWSRFSAARAAQACEACNQGPCATLPLLEPINLALECPSIAALPEYETTDATSAPPNVLHLANERNVEPACDCNPNAAPDLVAIPPAPIPEQPTPQFAYNEPLEQVQAQPVDAANPFAMEGADAPSAAPNKGRRPDRYVTPVVHRPIVVAAPALASDGAAETDAEVVDSTGAPTAETAQEPITDFDSTPRPAPPSTPAELPPAYETAPRYTAAPISPSAPIHAAQPEETNDASATFPAPTIHKTNKTARATTPKNLQSAEDPAPGVPGKQSGMTLRWVLPDALTLGQASACQLQVCNGTDYTAQNVTISAQLSAGVRVEHVEPRPTSAKAGALIWEMGDMAAGANSAIQISIVPEELGEFSPLASVTSMRSIAAKVQIVEPRLAITIEGPREAIVGQATPFHVRVINQGTGAATGIAVHLRLAEGLEGMAGFKPSYAIGTLAPGESRQVQVVISGRDQGNFAISGQTVLGNLRSATTTHGVRMTRPSLAVAVEGPKLRFVDRKAEYTIKVQNPGPGPIENVQLQESIPAGFRFVEASSGGSFDRQTRQVAWFVGHMEPNESANMAVQLVAIEAGEHRLNAEAKADFGVTGEAETTTTVRGTPRVVIEVTEDDDPVEVDGETVYRVRLTNTGSMPAHGVQFAGEAPREMQVLKINGPAPGVVKGQQVVFPAVDTLGPGETASYDIHVKCRKSGQVHFKAYFRSQDNPTPVLEEEMTRIYAE